MLPSPPASMKPSHTWLACSLLGVACAVSCGSDDEKTKVVAHNGGAGGEGGAAEPGKGGQGGEAAPTEGGDGGVPSLPAGGIGGDGAAGSQATAGGAGGEAATGGAPACLGFAESSGGEGGGAPQPALHFTCGDLTGSYEPGPQKLSLNLLPGMEPTVSGAFVTTYQYPVSGGEAQESACAEGTISNTGDALQLNVTFVAPPSSFTIPALSLQDACGKEVALDASSQAEGFCHNITFYSVQDQETWTVDCYEGFGADCLTTPVCPTKEAKAR